MLNKAKKREKKSENMKRCRKCCALLGQKLSKKMKTKASCTSTKPFLVSETVSHSLALRVKWVIWLTFGEKHKITQQEEDNWQANCCVGINRNEGAGQQEHLSSQHQQFFLQMKSPVTMKWTARRQTAPPKPKDTNQLLLTLCKTWKSIQPLREEASRGKIKKSSYKRSTNSGTLSNGI